MTETQTADKSLVKRLLPIGIIAIALAAFFALGGPDYVNLDSLRDNREFLSNYVQKNLILTLIGFIGLYAALVAISFPGASFLSIFGGFMFGTFMGGGAIVIGATLGAALLFLAARYAIGDMFTKRAGPYMHLFMPALATALGRFLMRVKMSNSLAL